MEGRSRRGPPIYDQKQICANKEIGAYPVTDELLTHVVARLLTAVRTTVRIAHIHQQDCRDFIFLPIQFECLEELTLLGYFYSSYKPYIPFLPGNTTIRRLRMDHVDLDSPSSTLIDSITAFAPQLTHLYCRLANYSSKELVAQLDKLLSPPPQPSGDEPSGDDVNHARFPATLQKLYIHPGMRDPPMWCGTGLFVRVIAKRSLFEFCWKPENEGRVVLFKEEQYREERLRMTLSLRQGEDEWLDRIGGGLGCWDESNQMEALY